MAYRFPELVDGQALAELLSSLYKATGLPSMVLDEAGAVVASAGWMPGCGLAHLDEPCLSLVCRRGAAALGLDMGPGGGSYMLFKCPMGFCDAVAPILLEGRVLGGIHMGQFLLTPPDMDAHEATAKRLGPGAAAYMEGVRRMPVLDVKRLERVMGFYGLLTRTLAEQGLKGIRLATADSALAVSESRYRRLLASVTNYIYTVRLEKGRLGTVTHGPGCETVTGYSPAEFDLDSLLWIRLVHEKERQRVLRYFESILAGNQMEPLEHRIRRRDGAVRWIRNTPVVMRGPSGELTQFEGLVQDITEQKIMEEELRAARLKAEQANQAKSDFLANMSHEIRTPMNAVLGLTRLAQRRVADPEAREFLDGVAEAGTSLLAIINDILDFSKIEAGRLEIMPEDFDPVAVLEQAARTLAVQAGRKGLDLKVVLDRAVPRQARADPVRVRQVLLNLLGNAVKFTSSGSVTLKAVMEAGGVLHASVEDTGIGIEPDKLEMIFDTFTQADSTTTRRFGGTGLGLAISRQLAEMMGGAVRATSVPGAGSSFHFTVPLAPPLESASTVEAAPSRPLVQPGGRLRILLVEDEPANRIFARTWLNEDGHEVAEAENGAQALEKLALGRFDVVLMDVSMPVMDGLEATRLIRSGHVAGLDPAIPVIALTAHAIKGDKERFLASGMDACVVKPLDMDELNAILGGVRGGGSTRPASAPRIEPDSGFDLDWLRKWFSGREGTLATLTGIFRDEAPRRLRAMREALAAGEAGKAAAEAHSLKGSAAVLGARGVRKLASSLESAARAGDVSSCGDGLNALEAEIRAAITALEAGFPELADPDPGQPSSGQTPK